MILSSTAEACRAGARLSAACELLGIDPRTIQRWRSSPGDQRSGPKTVPGNKLTAEERARVVEVATSAEFRNLSPKQIVPALADQRIYVASESTFYRVLKEAKLDAHRGPTRERTPRPLAEHVATGPCQVWSWDITYLRAPIRGQFFYLYLILDVWSRKAVGAQVYEAEDGEYASQLIAEAIVENQADAHHLVLHQDNGSPMKGATLKAKLEELGIMASYSRPQVSNDNPYSESIFKTAKYRPWYPQAPFENLDAAREWAAEFVHWYNHVHLHSSIGFVTPAERHARLDEAKLAARKRVYRKAQQQHPERWSGNIRSWTSPRTVYLNPSSETRAQQENSK